MVEEPSEKVKAALIELQTGLELCDWNVKGIGEAIKKALGEEVKMSELAPVIRTMLLGITDAPAIDVIASLFERGDVLAKLKSLLKSKEIEISVKPRMQRG